MQSTDRVAIIGAGHVGSAAGYALMLRALFREIVLIDTDPALAEAEATDISDANALARPSRIWQGSYADASSARIVVITAGAATHGDETRLSVAERSGEIVGRCVDALMKRGFDGLLVIASNPVDLMTLHALRTSGLPPARVIGTGTLLDSSRLQQALSEHLEIAPSSIDVLVLGEHGDSEVAIFSTARIGGAPLGQVTGGDHLKLAEIASNVRTAGYRIIAGKGYTSYGIATAIVRICEAIIRDEHAVLPISTLLTGELGVSDVCMSLPCVLGATGIEQVLLPDMSSDEADNLRASASTLADAMKALPIGSVASANTKDCQPARDVDP